VVRSVDEEWERLAPLIPIPPWRDVPERYGKWAVVDEATMTEFVEVIDQTKARQKGAPGRDEFPADPGGPGAGVDAAAAGGPAAD